MNEENSHIEEHEKEFSLKDVLETSYPLLQKFRNLCPGTYKHSQSISSMVEGIALDLELDVTFMKVLGLYHDVGKMFNPLYFSENQLDEENPHEKLDPKISYQIISRHVSDTALILLNDGNFPRDLIKIAAQHHGTNIIQYFFEKSGSEVDDYFRYKTEKPARVESAILMICDCIEATSRSQVQKRGPGFDPSIIIEDTINRLLIDSQLDDVYMRLGDLQKIKDALAKELQGTYQKRVDYKKAKEENNGKLTEK